MIKRRRQSRLAIAPCHDFGVWPDLKTDFSERATVLLRRATRKENSSTIDLAWQFGKDGAKTLGCSEPKIRWWQFSLIENAKFGAGCVRYGLDQCPGGFGSAAFNPEDAITGFHNSLRIDALRGISKRGVITTRRGKARSPLRAGPGARSARVGARAQPFDAAIIANTAACRGLPVLPFITPAAYCRAFAGPYREKIDGPNGSREEHCAIARGNPQA